MKTRKLLILAVCALALNSCYEDLSTDSTIEIPDLLINTDTQILNVAYGHDLVVEPEVIQEGRTEEDFEYLWEIDLKLGNATDRIELGTTKNLCYRVSNTPSDNPYALTLRVTDKLTGLQKYQMWEVYVSSSLGEGVLVATTTDGGQTSDVTLLASPAITYGFSGDNSLVTEGLYSFANGSPVQGRINTMVTAVVTDGAVFNTTRIMLGTDEHIIALNPVDYSERERDATLFNSKETEFGTQMVFNFGDYATAAIINNRFFCCIGNFDRAYTKMPVSFKNPNAFFTNNIAYDKPDQGKVLMFNEEDGKFHSASILSVSGGMSSIDVSSLGYSLSGAKPIAGVCLKESAIGMILKLKTGKYHLYTFDLSLINPTIKDIDLSGVKNLSKATCFAYCDNANIIYFVAENKINTIVISGGKATTKVLSWTPANKNEKITSLTQFAQSWYGTSQNSFNVYPFTLQYHRSQLMICTYNETDSTSTVYFRPFSISTGLFSMKDNGSITVPGEITALCTTPR